MLEAVLGLGSNLGDREQMLRRAVEAIDRLPGTCVRATSSLYKTAPFGVPDEQPEYINCCVRIATRLSPQALLGACLGVEAALGRERPWEKAARVVDIDLLLYEGARIQSGELILPHPRMGERAFVLVPLHELFPEGCALGIDFQEAFARVSKEGVCKAGVFDRE